VLSDMDFDGWTGAASVWKTEYQGICDKFAAEGFAVPQVVFWNVGTSKASMPVVAEQEGAALVTVAEPGICGWVCQIPSSATGCCCATKGASPVLSAAAVAPAAPGRRGLVVGRSWACIGQVAASPDARRRAGAGEDATRLAGAGREPGGERRLTGAGGRG